MMKFCIHYFLHFLAPLLIAIFLFKKKWKKVYLIFLASMLIDLDHLLATPIFDPNRCSINFHPLHTYTALFIYVIFLLFSKTRLIGIALVFHLFTDYLDCHL
ncbi:DUF6122 family protein [Polaribacter sp.]|nr:DUF6122 family protein [Polaribacter sp.]